MRRTIPATMAILLTLGSAPVLAQEAEDAAGSPAAASPAAESPAAQAETQEVYAPAVGLTISFPAGWRVGLPEGERVSALTSPDGEPIMETTAVMANGGDAGLCDVDVYLDMTAPLRDHAYAYAAYLQQTFGSVPMVVTETELPAGNAYRIEIVDAERDRIRSLFLFDGVAAEDGSFDRFLLSCATPSAAEPIGQAVAETVVIDAPAAAEEPAAE